MAMISPMPNSWNASFMLTTAPRTSITVLWSCLVCGQQLVDARSHALQRLGFGGDIDVDHAANLVVIHFGGRVDLLNVGHRAQRHIARCVIAVRGPATEAGSACRPSCMGA